MSDNFEILLAKYFAGDADESEQNSVNEWIEQSEENRREFERYRILWEKSERTGLNDEQVEYALKQTKKNIPEFGSRSSFSWLRQVAAVLVVSLLLSSLYNYFNTHSRTVDNKSAVQEITAFNGMSTRIDLPDGSTVDLFPGSKLIFPVSFSSEVREVKLTGEGYFCIFRNEKVPFVVKTAEMDVKVLGTKFNLRANADEDFVETILVEGKVSLEKEIKGKTVKMQILKPAQRAVYIPGNDRLKVYEEKDMEKHLAWTKGTLMFDADPLEKVVRELERWYNVDIVVKDDKLKKYRLTGMFNGESIGEVLSLLKFSSDFNYKIVEGKMNKGKLSKRKIIITK